MRKMRLRKLNNQGSTFVLAIIVITLVTMLAVAILAASSHNIAMKNVDRNSKVNFYTAEAVIDEVSAGVGLDGMRHLGAAYEEVLTTLIADNPLGYEYTIDNNEANKKFRSIFIETMLDTISGGELKFGSLQVLPVTSVSEVAKKNIIDYLTGYIKGYVDGKAEILHIGSVEAYKDADATTGRSYMIIIRDVSIRYKENKGGETYFSNVTTDIEIQFPNLNVDFSATNRLDDYTKYVFIADDNIEIKGRTVTSKACIYAGGLINVMAKENYIAKLCMNGDTEEINIVCGGNSDNGVTGTIALTGSINTKAYLETICTDIWCTNIKTNTCMINGVDSTNGAVINITNSTDTFMKDDLTINGKDTTVELAGNYYGYSYDGAQNLHANSSAIIINGKKASVNIATNKLLLGGYSYIDLSDSDYYMLGESLSFRGDQEIYLVPSDYLGIGYDVPIPNPMSKETFNALVAAVKEDDSDVEFCNFEGFFAKGYMKTGTYPGYDMDFANTTLVERKNVACPYVVVPKGNIVYVYCNFSSNANAAKYVSDIANGNGAPLYLQKLLDQYTQNLFEGTTVKIDEGAKDSLYTQGSMLVTTKGSTSSQAGKPSTTVDSESYVGAYNAGLSGYAYDEFTLTSMDLGNRYTILTHLLSDIPWDDDITGKKYIVNDIDNAMLNKKDYIVTNEMSSTSVFDIIIDRGMITEEYEYNSTNSYLQGEEKNYIKVVYKGDTYTIPEDCQGGIVVATGDVIVQNHFHGMIIAGRNIYVTERDINVTNDDEFVRRLIQTEVAFMDGTEEDIPFREYFKAFKHSASEDDSREQVKIETVDYKDIIKINNWRKYEEKEKESGTS